MADGREKPFADRLHIHGFVLGAAFPSVYADDLLESHMVQQPAGGLALVAPDLDGLFELRLFVQQV